MDASDLDGFLTATEIDLAPWQRKLLDAVMDRRGEAVTLTLSAPYRDGHREWKRLRAAWGIGDSAE